ncbi:Uncharacterized protein OBRU01_05739, partial [Operophtera brumata]
SIAALRRQTRFTEPELKRLYRGFKAECPTGVGESEHINLKVLGQDNAIVQFKIKKHTPLRKLMNAYCDRAPINENDTPTSLEMEEGDTIEVYQQQTGGALKLRWTFSLYDINGDGYITKEEMTEIVNAIYDLMGRIVDPNVDDEIVRDKVEKLFQKMDLNRDGVLTIDEFLDCCLRDEALIRSMGVFDSSF